MSLGSGTRLGPYEILAPLGSGGMGDVYTARDTRLDRRVAVKVSKEQFSARFEREARAAAALNHPNICQLYDVGPNYLVMEYVDGVPLAPVDDPRQALDVGLQLADALVSAHAAGVVHRDLKPANIVVTPSGQVKVLDFGLALMSAPAVEASGVTREALITAAGSSVGTPAYMSPEQARGEAVDARSDLWSLGVVLYELSTESRPFDGPTSAVVFEELLSKTPVAPRTRNSKVPPELDHVIIRLLEKDRETRYQSAADVRADLKRIARDASGTDATAPARLGLITSRRGMALTMLALAAVTAWLVMRSPGGPVTSPTEYMQLTDFADSVVDPNLSPDGRMVTFIRSDSAQFPRFGEVYVKLVAGGEAVRLTSNGTPKYGAVFTPDGSRVAYTQIIRAAGGVQWETWTVPIGGGESTRMLPNASGMVWIDDQHLLFSEIKGTGLHMGVVTATTGRADKREIYFPDHERAMAHYSYLSPDRRTLLIVEMDRSNTFQPCRLTPFDGSSPGRQVGPRGQCTAAAWSPDGQWMYFSVAGAGVRHLWRQRFPDGQPEQITFGSTDEDGVAVSADGRSLLTAVGQERGAIWMHDAKGERQLTTEGVAFSPVLSSDGNRLYYLLRPSAVTSASVELRAMDLTTGRTDRVVPDRSVEQFALSRDEREIAFTTRTSDGISEIWVSAVDRSTPARRVVQGGDQVWFGSATELIFRSLDSPANTLQRVQTDGSGRQRIMETPILMLMSVSPNGEWALAGVFGAGERSTTPTQLVPVRGGTPMPFCSGCFGTWSPNGKWMYLSVRGGQTMTTDTYLAVPTGVTEAPPDGVAESLAAASSGKPLPGTSLIAQRSFQIAPGSDPSTYAFVKRDVQRNLFRIPLH